MSVSDEDLLGFALGALEPADHERVAAALKVNPILRQRLADIQAALAPLDEILEEDHSPPPDLLEKTLARLEAEAFEFEDAVQSGAKVNLPEDRRAASSLNSSAFFSGPDGSLKSGFRFWDSLALSACVLVVASLLFPAIINGRSMARQMECSQHLSSLATWLTEYASLQSDGRIPEVPTRGYRSFAGIYAIQLNDCELLEDRRAVWCPSVASFADSQIPELPSDAQLMSASPQEWLMIREWVGGNYAYNLGVLDRRRVRAPRYMGRTHFAWLGDAPILISTMRDNPFGLQALTNKEENQLEETNQSTFSRLWGIFSGQGTSESQQPSSQLTWVSHDGRGINIVFEDGHVAFVDLRHVSTELLEPYLNHAGSLEAGVEPNDSALGPSSRGPWMIVPSVSRSAR
jgi:prepilin-type processing-associated H-X9-DG protein